MKKLFGNWIFIFIVSLLALFIVFYSYMLKDAASQPSIRWSKELPIVEIDNSKISYSTRPRIVTIPIEQEKRCLIFWNEKDSLKMIPVDSKGKVGKEKRIAIKLGEPVKMNAYLENDRIYFYLIESGTIKKYCYEYRRDNFYLIGTIAEHVNFFKLDNGNLFIASDDEILMIDTSGKRHLICKPGGQLIDVFEDLNKDGDHIYNIATTISDGNTQILINYCEYNLETSTSKVREIGKQALGNNETGGFDSLLIGACNGKMNIMVSRKILIPWDTCRRLPKGTMSKALLYSFDKNDIRTEKIKTSLINDVTHVEPNPVKNYIDDKRFGFITSMITSKGRNTYSVNLMQYEFSDGKVEEKELLTKTKDISRGPFWFKLDNKEFLQWEDRTGSSTKIMLASTDKEIIKEAGKLNWQIAWMAFLDSLMPLGFSLSYLLLFFSCIMLPTFIFIFVIAIFFMNWSESNNKKATTLACGIHVLAELLLLKYFDLNKLEVISIEPMFLQNSTSKIVIVIVIAALTYFCLVRRFNNDKYDKSFVNQYGFFALINMILFVLLIFPYYYI